MEKTRLIDFDGAIAIILSFVGGILDVYCLFSYNVYATMHTGNVIKLAIGVIDGNLTLVLITLFMLLAFAIGLVFVNFYEKRVKRGDKGLLILCIVFLIAATFVPHDTDPGTLSVVKMISAALFGFEGSFLIHSFIKFGKYSYSSTTMTANINKLITNVYDRATTKDKSKNYSIMIYTLIILFFLIGVGGGYAFLKFLPKIDDGFFALYEYNFLLIIPIICTSVVLWLTILKNKKKIETRN
ncbi:MAG: YoaK family protein [Clostridia bacterium]|nr:YoaK family protein [Clostridia bacterium]